MTPLTTLYLSYLSLSLLLTSPLIKSLPEEILSAERLREAIERDKINIMWLTASLFNQLIAEEGDLFEGLEYLLIGGEALQVETVRSLVRRKERRQES